MRKLLSCLAVLVAALSLTTAAAAETEEPVSIGEPLHGKMSASFAPRVLSRSVQTPIVLRAASTYWMEDGTRLPTLDEYQLRFDRHMRLDLEEVPVCSGAVFGPDGPGPEKACEDAVIARGRMTIDIRFPETIIPLQTSDVVVYNGGERKGGRAMLFLYTNIETPVSAAIVIRMEVKPVTDRPYGLEATAEIPKIAGGSGSITHLGLRFHKGIFTATCGRTRQLRLSQRALFADGTLLQGALFRVCTPSG